MKSAVETLGPTRVKLTVEVPFDELKPAVDAAYRKIAQQVRVRGFRPGKVPPRILDQQVGRGAVLNEAVQEAVPQFYGEAVRTNEVRALGHPELEVTEFADGDRLEFTAEVDVRPDFELPELAGLPVTVDDAEPSDTDIDEQVAGLRDRFAVLRAAERPVETGDYVMLDLAATVDGEDVEEARATGLSYEVGSASLVEGLDDALLGAAEGDARTFTSQLRFGPYAGRDAEVTATVRSVKVKELPELDDEFAQTASEFDTMDELKADIRGRLSRVRRLQQGLQARDRVLEVLLERVELPIPEHVLGDEVAWRQQNLQQQLDSAGLTREAYLASEGKTAEEFENEVSDGARQAIKAQFVLERIAETEELGVTEAELTEAIVGRAQRAGVPADQLAQQIVQSGQLGALMSEVLRTKALAFVLEQATVTDASGRPVDLEALRRPDGLGADELDAAEDLAAEADLEDELEDADLEDTDLQDTADEDTADETGSAG